MIGVRELQELLLRAPVLIAVQQGEQLKVLPMRLHERGRLGLDEVAARLSPQDVPALDRWFRAKAEEVLRSGEPAVGVEEPLEVEWSPGGEGAETRYLTYVCGPLGRRGAAPEGAATFAIDVTAAVRAQSGASADRKWFEAAIDAIGTPIVLAEPGTEQILFANAAARELSRSDLTSGSTFGEAVGLRSGFYCTDVSGAPIPADQLPGARASRGEVVEAMELSWHTPSGAIALLCFAEKVPASGALPSLLVLSFFDVTQLRRVQRRVSELIAGRDEFLRLAAHELRTPITVLKLHAQALARKHPEVSGLSAIERATVRMERLAEEMLTCADILEHGVRLRPEELDLCAVVDGVTERLEGEAAAAGCGVARVGARSLAGCWDRDRLEQVLGHLVRNAIRFGARKQVLLECADLGRRVSVTVADQGIGIDPADHERIFERFTRVASPRNFGGLGLGLWMVREIVRAMGGEVRVESTLGAGARFTVELPRRPSEASS